MEVACRLRQDAAVQGGTSLEQNVGLDQKDALHVCCFSHLDVARNLPEDVLHLCAAHQLHVGAFDLRQVPRYLNDEDVAGSAIEVDVRSDGHVCAEGVDACCQWSCCAAEFTAESTGSEIEPPANGCRASRGVSVRGLHGADRGGQMPRNGCEVGRREGLARDLRGRRKLTRRVSGEAEAGHGGIGDGRDGDVTCNGGGGNGGDAALGEDHIVCCRQEFDRRRIGLQLTVNTSDGLGLCRKREEEEEEEAASVGREHDGLENLGKRECVKVDLNRDYDYDYDCETK